MNENNIRISIVTINYLDIDGLGLTCRSVESQSCKPYEHVIVASGYPLARAERIAQDLYSPYRSFYFNIDRGIYDAMNIGLKKISGDYVLFLNSGDSFLHGESLAEVLRWHESCLPVEIKKCHLFASVQIFGNDAYYRPPFRSRGWNIFSIPHQSCFCPVEERAENRILFKSESLSADQEWIVDNTNRYGYSYSLTPISMSPLGGISTNSSFNGVVLRIKRGNYVYGFKALVRFLLALIIGKHCVYYLLAMWNGYGRIPMPSLMRCEQLLRTPSKN